MPDVHRRIRARGLVPVLGAAVLATALASGCSEHTSGEPSASGLARAMDSVSGEGPAQQEFAYGDFARLREIGALRPHAKRQRLDSRWAGVIGIGSGTFAQVTVAMQAQTGITPLDYDTAVHVGEPPNSATKFTGSIDKSTITARLKALGATPRTYGGVAGLTLAPDNRTGATKVPGLVNELNHVVVTDSELAASRNGAALQAVLGDTPSLLQTGSYREIADCLGDVVVAVIISARHVTNARVVAVGVRNPGSLTATAHEVLCALPASGKLPALQRAMAAHLAVSSTSGAGGQPLSKRFSAIAVATKGPLVRAVFTDRPSSPVGMMIRALYTQAYQSWLED